MKLNEKIFYCRRKAGLSQEALAEKLGVSRQAVSKWETGDAVPEIGKLLALAKQFDVTTDWLLSEDEPEEETKEEFIFGRKSEAFSYEEEQEDTVSSGERLEQVAGEWIDCVPGIFRKLVKKFGWIAGVYIAAGGGMFTLFGVIAKAMVSGMTSSFNNAANSMFGGNFGGNSITFFDANGNPLSSAESAQLSELLQNSGQLDGFSSYENGFLSSGMDAMNGIMQNNPVSILANIFIIGGLIALVGGTIFAVSWYKKAKEAECGE